jgi:hypothetical protein
MKKIKNILDAPEGYFEQLPPQIQKKVQQKMQKKSIWQTATGFNFSAKYALAFASIALLLVFGGKYLINNKIQVQEIPLNEISEQHIEQYLLQSTEIQENELVEYLQDSNVPHSPEINQIEEMLEDEVDFEEIEEML